jgi:hypothetical protein
MKRLAIRVNNQHESEAVQQALFDMGFEWISVLIQEQCTFEDYIFLSGYIKGDQKIIDFYDPHLKRSMKDGFIFISFSEFFEKYAGHIELFPDYEKPEMSEGNKVWSDKEDYLCPNCKERLYFKKMPSRSDYDLMRDASAIRNAWFCNRCDKYFREIDEVDR